MAKTAYAQLVERDKEAIWHPYSRMPLVQDPIPIVRGKGMYLYAADGSSYIDAISSWWTNLHGHAHPYIVERIREQATLLEHVIFADFTHPGAIHLAERLLKTLPGNMSKIFYSDNGSTAVEVAIKMALQYWYNKNSATKKVKIVCMKGSYHGDTFGTMSAAGRNEFNRPFWGHLFDVESIDPPYRGREEHSLVQLKEILQRCSPACCIFEPLVLGSGGMLMYPPEGLDALIQLCRKHEVLTIADEVMTGFGRTGPLFACESLKESPDLICLSKGITGGFLPLGATACTAAIFDAFSAHTFLHGHSYTANPLACSAALASLDLLERDECTQARNRIGEQHKAFCAVWQGHPQLNRCESIGTILALEYRSEKITSYCNPLSGQLYRHFLEQNILLRPLGNVLYVMPPYCITDEELRRIYGAIITTLEIIS